MLPQVLALDRRAVRRRFEQRFYRHAHGQGLSSSLSFAVQAAHCPWIEQPPSSTLQPVLEKEHELTGVSWRSRASRSRNHRSMLFPRRRSTFRRPVLRRGPRRALKHDDTFVVARQPRRHRRFGRRPRRAVPLRHALSLASRALAQRHCSRCCSGSNLRDDNTLLTVDLTNPDMYFDEPPRAAEGHAARRAHDFSLARHRLSTAGDPQPWRSSGRSAPDHAVRQRLRRPVRGARPAAGTPRHHRQREVVPPGTAVLSYKGLDAQLRQTSLHFDPPPDEITATRRLIASLLRPSRRRRSSCTIGCGAPEPPQPVGPARRCARSIAIGAPFRATPLHRRTLQRPLQRGAVPVDVRSLHADDQHAAGPLSLCRHSLVLDHVRPRRIDHRAADALARSPHRAGRAAAARGLSGQDRRCRCRTRSRERSCTRCANGEMAALREVPFGLYYGSVDATPLFVMLAGLYVERTGDDATIVELWPAIEAALAWIDGSGDPDGDGFVEYYRATEQGLANQGWKDSAGCDLPRRRPPGGRSDRARGGAGLRLLRQAAGGALRQAPRDAPTQAQELGAASRSAWPSDSTRASGVRRSAPTRWRSTARRSRAACAAPMPVRFCSPASPSRSGRCEVADGLHAAAILLRMGHSHHRQYRSALQSDVLSQRFDLAARQCADRARNGPLRPEAFGRAPVQGACSMPRPTWRCADCPSCSAVFSADAGAARRSIRWPARRRHGPAPRPSR